MFFSRPAITSFRDARDLSTTALFDNLTSEDEYLIIYDLNSSNHLGLPYVEFMRFDLDEIEDSECVAEFRVYKDDLPALDSRDILVPTTFYQQWYGRAVHASLETCILMWIFANDSALWKTRAGSERDNE